MPAILSKVRDDVTLAYSKMSTPAVCGCAAGAVAVGLVGYKLLSHCASSKSCSKKYSSTNGTRHINNNYEKALIEKCKTPTTCSAKLDNEKCNVCKTISECENNQNIGISDVEKVEKENKLFRTLRVPGLNKQFAKEILILLKVMVPKAYSKEAALLAVHTLCLFTRTFLSIYVATLEGTLVKFIVKKDVRKFLMMLLKWFGIAIPATFINSMIRYLESKLAVSFRSRLVDHAYRMYFKNQTYYRVSNLDNRIENADHRLTEDVSVFASSCAHLYSHLTKPCFDLLLIVLTMARSAHQMRANIVAGPILAAAVIMVTGNIMRILSPKFGQLASEEAQRNGYLRHIHSRIIAHAEEIAFYGGHKVELSQLFGAYDDLVKSMDKIFGQKLWFVMLEQFFMKYVWSGTGMIMVALPILTGRTLPGQDSEKAIGERSEYLTTSRNLLSSAADAIERLMSSYKEIVTLAGYTHRVANMFQVFDETSSGKYVKTSIDDASPKVNNISGKDDGFNFDFVNGQPIAKGIITYTDDLSIDLIDVPIVTPNCDVMVTRMNLHIEPGQHLIITGPNGCGKSSLFRIVSGLWPVYAGELKIPRNCECASCTDEQYGKRSKTPDNLQEVRCQKRPTLFYIPQRPYLSMGTLLDQVIYPETPEEFKIQTGGPIAGEARVRDILQLVCLGHVLAREGLYSVRDWRNTLSGGEKQRMAMARLFYHKPVYALLDECTSAVSLDTEIKLYEFAIKEGITLLSITHRPSLWKYHKHILKFDGVGNWSYELLAQPEEKPSS